jgi:hypothetical protein
VETDALRRTQLAENMRFFNDLRFKQLSLLMAGMTLVGAGVAQYPSAMIARSLSLRSGLAFCGMLFTAVMLVMEVRSTMHFIATREQAPDLWPVPYPSKLRWVFTVFTTAGAVLSLHIVFYWFWFWCATEWYPHPFALIPFLLLGAILSVSSVLTYWYLGRYASDQERRGLSRGKIGA